MKAGMQDLVVQLTELLLNQHMVEQRYFCLMLSYLMSYHAAGSPVIVQMAKYIISKLNTFSSQIQKILLNNIFTCTLIHPSPIPSSEGKSFKEVKR